MQTMVTVTDPMQEKADAPETADPVSSVYPNPARDLVTIHDKSGVMSADHIQIVDAYGRVFTASAKTIDEHSVQVNISKLASGVYTILAKVDNGYRKYRVVKE